MKTFQNGIANVLFYVIGAALMFYAASRSLHFITSTLSSQDKIIGYLALAATSGGMISWLLVFLHKADGLWQKITASLMVAIDLCGEIALFTFDTLYTTGKNGMTAALLPDEIRLVVLVLSGVIAMNILATVVFHVVEPENMRRMREGFVRDHLENEALKQIEKHGEEIARELAPALAQQWRKEFTARFSDLKSLGLGTISEKPKDEEKKPILSMLQKTPPLPINKADTNPLDIVGNPSFPLAFPSETRRNGNGQHE